MVVTGVRFHPSRSVYHKNDLDVFLLVIFYGFYPWDLSHHYFSPPFGVRIFCGSLFPVANLRNLIHKNSSESLSIQRKKHTKNTRKQKTQENNQRISTNHPHHLFVFALCTFLCHLCEPPGPITTINGFTGAPWLVVFETAKALPLDVPNNQRPQPASPAGE